MNLLINMVMYFINISERREIYFIAIIDVLTQYGMKKQVMYCTFLKWLYEIHIIKFIYTQENTFMWRTFG